MGPAGSSGGKAQAGTGAGAGAKAKKAGTKAPVVRRRKLDSIGGSHWRLPAQLLTDVMMFLREPEELVGISIAFPGAMTTLKCLPDWHAQVS